MTYVASFSGRKGGTHTALPRYFSVRNLSEEVRMNDFYVYAHYRETDGRIFYVGKGRGYRWKDGSENTRNNWWQNTVAKHGYKAEKLAMNVSEKIAFDIEKKLIAFYGRADLGHGQLVNLTDGGDYTSTGYRHTDEVKGVLSKAAKVRMSDPAARARLARCAKRQFTNPKMRKRFSESAKKRFSNPKNNPRYDSTKYRFVNKKTGQVVHKTKYEMRELLGVGTSEISALVNGKRRSCRGWFHNQVRARAHTDTTLYAFVHHEQGERKCRRVDLCREFDLSCSAMTLLVQGKINSTKGWSLAI